MAGFQEKSLCFVAAMDGSSVALKKVGAPHPISLAYSHDGDVWNFYTPGKRIYLEKTSDKAFFRAVDKNEEFSKSEDDYYHFELEGKVFVFGKANSLLREDFGTSTVPKNGFYALFRGCKEILTMPEIPFINIGDNGCCEMFRDCTSLQEMTALPAMHVGAFGCRAMFKDCFSLVSASPVLPAPMVEAFAYMDMFAGCRKLEMAPKLELSKLSPGCCVNMFQGCFRLKKAPCLTAPMLVNKCYEGMFHNCHSLDSAPALMGVALAPRCYSNIFAGCSLIDSVEVDHAGVLTANEAAGWLDGCAPNGNIYVNDPEKTFIDAGDFSVLPQGWTVKTK